MHNKRKIELLAPAKNLLSGMEAIKHGADAVYIGAPMFGARASACNSIEDIKQLVDYAHLYRAKVYIALNTIFKDKEIDQVQQVINDIYLTGADALIIQDMGILELDLPPIAIHASTQMDNRSVEKVQFLEKAGFSQVVLARELSLKEINNISDQCQVNLEVFVHGAICVSYSGQCYISQAFANRSANRGNCAQYCRMPYTLEDADGKIIVNHQHLLSPKDMNRSAHLEKLIDAGVCSLKIEGRLKDLSYVKNITAYYRSLLDEIFARRDEYTAASDGKCSLNFMPKPEKSFNRGFTDYFMTERNRSIISPATPKSMGEEVGIVSEIKNNEYFEVAGTEILRTKILSNGDGLCFINKQNLLEGFRVNRVDNKKIYPIKMPNINKGDLLYRNYDHQFEKLLAQNTAERKIKIKLSLKEDNTGFILLLDDETNIETSITQVCEKVLSEKSQEENIHKQLSKLGNTIFCLDTLSINLSQNWFIPSSILSLMKRNIIQAHLSNRKKHLPINDTKIKSTNHPFIYTNISYLGNVSNHLARKFYTQHGALKIDKAFEIEAPKDAKLMLSKHCIRYDLGYCKKLQEAKESDLKEPLFLCSDQIRLKLSFDCKNCMMIVSNA
ncbi:peptidase [Bacteroidales bacterium]|nr:peptidase [Bacteroidales bacterium]